MSDMKHDSDPLRRQCGPGIQVVDLQVGNKPVPRKYHHDSDRTVTTSAMPVTQLEMTVAANLRALSLRSTWACWLGVLHWQGRCYHLGL
jgi:hypothetical protein